MAPGGPDEGAGAWPQPASPAAPSASANTQTRPVRTVMGTKNILVADPRWRLRVRRQTTESGTGDFCGRGEHAVTFDQIRQRWRWTPIRGCPGRFVLTAPEQVESATALTPHDLAGADLALVEYVAAAAPDVVVVGRLDGGGLISYRRSNGRFVHTLNTTEGFARKLEQLGIGPAAAP